MTRTRTKVKLKSNDVFDVNCITLNDLRRGLKPVADSRGAKMTKLQVGVSCPNGAWQMSVNDTISVDNVVFHGNLEVEAVVVNIDVTKPRAPHLDVSDFLSYMDEAEAAIVESNPDVDRNEIVFLVRICNGDDERTLIPFQAMPVRGFGLGVVNMQFHCIRPENLQY